MLAPLAEKRLGKRRLRVLSLCVFSDDDPSFLPTLVNTEAVSEPLVYDSFSDRDQRSCHHFLD